MKKRADTHNSVRYHMQLANRRTTVSMDSILSDLLAIKLKVEPGTAEAHTAVRELLESFIDDGDRKRDVLLTRYVKDQAILYLVDKNLSTRYIDFYLSSKHRR